LGHRRHPTPLCLTEFAPALTTPLGGPVAAPAVEITGSEPQWAPAAQRGGFPGRAFRPQAHGPLRCPAGAPRYAQEHRPEREGRLRVLSAARLGACRAWARPEQCQGYGADTQKTRRVSAVLWPLPQRTPEGTGALALPPPAGPIRWGDGGRTQNRRHWLDLLRTQTVIRSVFPKEPAADASPRTPYTRRHRAQGRLSWSQPLARNACPANQAQARLHRFGIPPTVSTALDWAVAC
jgi:hypothetical protein